MWAQTDGFCAARVDQGGQAAGKCTGPQAMARMVKQIFWNLGKEKYLKNINTKPNHLNLLADRVSLLHSLWNWLYLQGLAVWRLPVTAPHLNPSQNPSLSRNLGKFRSLSIFTFWYFCSMAIKIGASLKDFWVRKEGKWTHFASGEHRKCWRNRLSSLPPSLPRSSDHLERRWFFKAKPQGEPLNAFRLDHYFLQLMF